MYAILNWKHTTVALMNKAFTSEDQIYTPYLLSVKVYPFVPLFIQAGLGVQFTAPFDLLEFSQSCLHARRSPPRATTMSRTTCHEGTSIVPSPTANESSSGAYRKSQLKLKRRFVHVVVGLVPEGRNGKGPDLLDDYVACGDSQTMEIQPNEL